MIVHRITKQIYEHVGTNSDRKEQVFDLISTLFTMQTGLMKQPWLIRKLQIGLIELTLTRRCKRAAKLTNMLCYRDSRGWWAVFYWATWSLFSQIWPIICIQNARAVFFTGVSDMSTKHSSKSLSRSFVTVARSPQAWLAFFFQYRRTINMSEAKNEEGRTDNQRTNTLVEIC